MLVAAESGRHYTTARVKVNAIVFVTDAIGTRFGAKSAAYHFHLQIAAIKRFTCDAFTLVA